ncbi:MAG: hypothetical protein QY314_02420 [Candidatus Dojkabacteria bacterium]|nr:MAG: hypothetical protein QY314_02420 [Candidatus Dojkabacteria bacterium]
MDPVSSQPSPFSGSQATNFPEPTMPSAPLAEPTASPTNPTGMPVAPSAMPATPTASTFPTASTTMPPAPVPPQPPENPAPPASSPASAKGSSLPLIIVGGIIIVALLVGAYFVFIYPQQSNQNSQNNQSQSGNTTGNNSGDDDSNNVAVPTATPTQGIELPAGWRYAENPACHIKIPVPDVTQNIIAGPLGSYMKWWLRTDSHSPMGMQLLVAEVSDNLSVLEVRYNASEDNIPGEPAGIGAGWGTLGVGVSAYCTKEAHEEYTLESYAQHAADLYKKNHTGDGMSVTVTDLGSTMIANTRAKKLSSKIEGGADTAGEDFHYLFIHKGQLYNLRVEGATLSEPRNNEYISEDRVRDVAKILEGIVLTE